MEANGAKLPTRSKKEKMKTKTMKVNKKRPLTLSQSLRDSRRKKRKSSLMMRRRRLKRMECLSTIS